MNVMHRKKEKDTTKNQNIADHPFYGPPSSCAEISKLGYTLNGYYLVKVKNQTKRDKVEVLGCQFKHLSGSKEGIIEKKNSSKYKENDIKINQNQLIAKEEKTEFIEIEIIKSVKRRSQEPFAKATLEEIENAYTYRPKRPARLLPLRMIR